MKRIERSGAALALSLAAACGATPPESRTAADAAREVVQMEEMRITSRATADGDYELTGYDAQMLFEKGTERLNDGRCEQALRHYDHLVEEFPTSRFVSPALYNAGLCSMQSNAEQRAMGYFERLVETLPESPDVKHASFQLTELYVQLERWQDAIDAADRLLAREDLIPDERVEAMARRAQGLLGLERIEQAASQARSALAYARSRPDDERVRETFFLGAANYVLAETLRIRAGAIEIPEADVHEQHGTLERRAQLILDAQRAYFDTIRKKHPHWGAAAGYRIGQMYDALWNEIMGAPVPPPSEPMPDHHLPVYEQEYRRELARLIKPLIRHSIRYWELTLMMIERTGVETEWKRRIREDLDRARSRLLEQPAGRGGLAGEAAESSREHAPSKAKPCGDECGQAAEDATREPQGSSSHVAGP